ncbi:MULTISPECIES: hypothetical protein [Exiguobacterium]|uniref:hypothetical protein n=1 Tax=Exiguobacterium TaxID=33986 RepID=UPI001BE52552|nr:MULTISPECIES: hypothetical protein [Exiguobacterium]MCT4778505.1 hypothetical protein [Exiguobacterium aquaticum]MCT4789640.1 hypothetical protein [Exiguobacterium mexicanum]
MIPNIEGRTRYSKSVKRHLKKIKPWKEGEWDKTNKNIKLLKSQLRSQLMVLQDSKCAYCGLKLNETSSPELEHIAPKGGKIRPQYIEFTFTPLNLVLACHLCNSPIKKGTVDPILQLNTNYKQCVFKIYHPFFDNPNNHFDYVGSGLGIVLQEKTIKGKDTIDMFDLNSEAHITARAKAVLYDFLSESLDSKEGENLINDILTYKK